MATIKDVAKHAGVSHGTVSNVLNGVKTVSLENIRKVEKAMKELGYQPHTSARILKSSSSKTVSIIFPYILDEVYSRFFTFIAKMLKENGYYPELYISYDIPTNENAILSQVLGENPAGIILVTCQPWNTELFQELLDQNTNLIFVDRKCDLKTNYVGFDNKDSVYSITDKYLKKGITDIALICGPSLYSSEKECMEGYEAAFTAHHLSVNKDNIHLTDFTMENSFRAASQLMKNGNVPSLIISSSGIISEGILSVLHYTCPENPPKLITLGEISWKHESIDTREVISKPVYEAAKNVTELLLSNIKNAPFFDYKEISLPNTSYDFSTIFTKNESETTIRALALKGDISDALETLLPYIKNVTNVTILLDSLPYEDLYTTLLEHRDDNYYDLYFFDLPWLHHFAENGILKDLTDDLCDDFVNEISADSRFFDSFSKHKNRIFALPFIYTSQLLFYRKDLFEDYKNVIKFRQEYNAKLAPPATWREYNAIARFFTRKYNPESQTEYGTTLGGQFSSASHCEFLTRMWAYNGNVFDSNGNVTLNTANVRNALENYIESYDYASPESIDHWWYEQVQEFADGKAAMMIMYSSHVAPIVDRNSSKILGQFGFAPVPGKKNTLGGWSMGINKNSRYAQDTLRVMKVLCSKELALPLTLLGCFSANYENINSNVTNEVYPWTEKSMDVFPYHVARLLPENKQHLSYKTYEQILAKAVRQGILKEASCEEVLKNAQAQLEQFLAEQDIRKI